MRYPFKRRRIGKKSLVFISSFPSSVTEKNFQDNLKIEHQVET